MQLPLLQENWDDEHEAPRRAIESEGEFYSSGHLISHLERDINCADEDSHYGIRFL